MGRGDKKSKKGKIFRGSYGVSRPRKTEVKNITPANNKTEKKESTVKKKTTTRKKSVKKSNTKKK